TRPRSWRPPMDHVLAEEMLTLAQVPRHLPPGRGGRPVTLGCVLRWVLQGARGPGGERVRLEAVRLGGRWITSKQALVRFAERLTPGFPEPQVEVRRTFARRQRASARAAAELERQGI